MKQQLRPPVARRATAVLGAALLLLAGSVAWADTRYKIESIVKLGETVAGVNAKLDGGHLGILGLTDRGQITFSTWVAEFPIGVAQIQYADGTFTPIAVAGREGPVGKWPDDLIGYAPPGTNGLGNFVWAMNARNDGDPIPLGTFLWEAQTQKWTPVARIGMAAGSDLTLEWPGWWSPVVNNRNEVAFPAAAKTAAGKSLDIGIFFTRPGGPIVPVAIPGDALPDDGTLAYGDNPTLNDAGLIAFSAVREDDPEDGRSHAYLWESGKLTKLVAVGTDAPGGGRIASVIRAWVNDANRNILILARRNNAESGPASLYLLTDGKLTAVAVPGQEMPGGGQFRVITLNQYAVSPPNSLGQHAFIATLADGSSAAYRMDADGKLSLILKNGTDTEIGTITQIARKTLVSGPARDGQGVGLNSQGQVALPVQIDGGPFTIVLLTPVTP